jgi:hypothetical protein
MYAVQNLSKPDVATVRLLEPHVNSMRQSLESCGRWIDETKATLRTKIRELSDG